jgi:hypothetical protein
MTDTPPDERPAPRRRRTVLVTSRWAASAAVIAAMTAGSVNLPDGDQAPSDVSSAVDPGDADDAGDAGDVGT